MLKSLTNEEAQMASSPSLPNHTPTAGMLLKIGDVVAETSLSRPTIYRAIARGEFPAQIRLTPRRVGWAKADIETWLTRQRNHSGGAAGGTG